MSGFRSRAADAHCQHVKISGETVEIPPTMKPWFGGDKAPDDFTGGYVKRLGGRFSKMPKDTHPSHWRHDEDDDDIVAYTPSRALPTTTPTNPVASEGEGRG